jgi:hypothetical protein
VEGRRTVVGRQPESGWREERDLVEIKERMGGGKKESWWREAVERAEEEG